MSSQNSILSNVMDKLDELPLEFNIIDSDLAPCLNDALREMKIRSLDAVQEGSNTELYVEIRTLWWMLHRKRTGTSVNFKYSTGIDGKSVDKSMIPQMIGNIMNDLDEQFSVWKSSAASSVSTTGVTWTRTQRTPTRLQETS